MRPKRILIEYEDGSLKEYEFVAGVLGSPGEKVKCVYRLPSQIMKDTAFLLMEMAQEILQKSELTERLESSKN